MKRKSILIILIAFLLALAVIISVLLFGIPDKQEIDNSSETEEIITRIEIDTTKADERLKYNTIMNNAYIKVFKNAYGDNTEAISEQISKVILPTDREEILKYVARAEAARKYLEKTNSMFSFEETKDAADSAFSLMKTDESQKSFYEALSSELVNQNIGESEFLELSYNAAFDFYNIQKAKQVFNNSSLTEEVPFEEMLDGLLLEMEIVYK